MDDVSLETGLPAPSTLYSAHETLRAFDTALPEVGHCWKTGSRRAVEGHAAPTVDPPWLIWSSWQGSSLFGHEEGWHSQPAGQLLSHCFHTLCWQDGGDGALLLLPHACGVQLETLRVDNSRRRCARGGCSRGFEAVWLLLGLAACRAVLWLPGWCLPGAPYPSVQFAHLTGAPWLACAPPCASSGLRVATHWSPQPDMLLTTARLYDADGRLLEVSTSTAIRHEEA